MQTRPSLNISKISGENEIEVLNKIELYAHILIIPLSSKFFKSFCLISVLLWHLLHSYIFQ